MAEGVIRVHCDKHRPMRYSRTWEFEECRQPECQGVMAARREAVKAAGAPTEEQKAAWRAQFPGRALPKAGGS